MEPTGKEGFFERVYQMVEQVPEGMVATYGQIAKLVGEPRRARYVGYALHVNPRPGIIPCHRIVFADGRSPPASPLAARKRSANYWKQKA